jgi:hypothetical protein
VFGKKRKQSASKTTTSYGVKVAQIALRRKSDLKVFGTLCRCYLLIPLPSPSEGIPACSVLGMQRLAIGAATFQGGIVGIGRPPARAFD